MAEKSTHSGGCHCGKVRYEVQTDLQRRMDCNCSICSRRGSILTFVGADDFRLLQGEGALTDYQFNKHVIHHLFCSTCGVASFARGKGADGKEMVAVNVRCLDDFDGVTMAATVHFDGKSR